MKKEISKTQTLQEGAYILLITALITKIIGAVFKIPLSSDNCLGDLGFGYFSASYDLLTPITTLALSGFPLAVSHYIALYVSQKKYDSIGQVLKVSKRFLGLVSIIGFIVVTLLIYPFVSLTDVTGKAIYGLIAILPSILFCGALSYLRGYFQGFLNMKPCAVSSLIEALCKLLLGYFFAFFVMKYTLNAALSAAAALFGITLGLAVATLYIYLKYKKHKGSLNLNLNVSLIEDNSALKRGIAVLSITFAISSLATSIVSFCDTLTVRTILSEKINSSPEFFRLEFASLLEKEGLEKLPTVLYGIRGKAFAFFNIVASLCMAIGVSVVPNISDTNADKTQIFKKINTALRITAFVSFPASFGFLLLGKRIMSLVFGEGMSADVGGRMLSIYGIAALFAGFAIVFGNILQSRKRHKSYFIAIAIATVVKMVLNILLTNIIRLNIYASAISSVVFFFTIFVISLSIFLKSEGKSSLKGVFLKPFIAGFICCLFAYLIANTSNKNFVLVLAIGFAVIIYFLLLLFSKFFKREDFIAIPFGKKIIGALKISRFLG